MQVGFMSMMVPCTTNKTLNSTVSGVCSNGTSSKNASISIMWKSSNETDATANNLTFYFQASKKSSYT